MSLCVQEYQGTWYPQEGNTLQTLQAQGTTDTTIFYTANSDCSDI